MNLRIKRIMSLMTSAALFIALFSGCSSSASESDNPLVSIDSSEMFAEIVDVEIVEADPETMFTDTTVDVDTSEMFNDEDYEVGYDEESSDTITLSGTSASSTSSSVKISGSTVTITDAGTYIVSGTLDNGMIIVSADSKDDVQIVLNGVSITSKTSAAIYVLNADKVYITTASGTSNTLTNGGSYVDIDENSIDAVIYSKDDLTLNGSGTLTITANAGHGIVSKDDLVITSGTYKITAASHGLSGKDCVKIAGGTYTISAGKDGIHSENSDDASLGYVYITGGTYTITATDDGISAGAYVIIDDGDFDITAGGGSKATVDSSSSQKGIKGDVSVEINGGTFVIDSANDSIHSAQNITISGGTFTITTADEGIQADAATVITDATIKITSDSHGLSACESVRIADGTMTIVSGKDGIHAESSSDTTIGFVYISGGSLDISADDDGISAATYVTIEGGNITIDAGLSSSSTSLKGIKATSSIKITSGTLTIDSADDATHSDGSITISGGTFTLDATDDGIQADSTLQITSLSSAKITAGGHGLSAGESVRIAKGSYTITATKDGIHAEDSTDTSVGFVYISNGTFKITADGDGISAATYLQIENGDFDITTADGAGEVSTSYTSGGAFSWDGWGGSSSSSDDSTSTKGLKGGTSVTISGGTFVIDSEDDGVHSNGDVTISGGTFDIATGDDGIHADEELNISGGTITITQSYEGLEGETVVISGGNIDLVSSDDGINAAGGSDSSGFGGFGGFGGDTFSSGSSSSSITISGGVTYVKASGDGIDSNGTFTMSGGTLYVSGPTTSADAPVDWETSGTITGGTLIAVGSSGMQENFGSNSTQGSMLLSASGSSGDTITLKDSSGNVLVSYTCESSYSCILISCPSLTTGSTYTITYGSNSTSVTLSSLIYSETTGMGGMTGGNIGGGNMDMGGSFDNSTGGMTTPDSGSTPGGDMGGNQGGGNMGGRGGSR